MNLPALTTTPGDMVAALARVAGEGTSGLVSWTDDPAVAAIVGNWPAHFVTRRANQLGLYAERSFDDVIRQFQSDNQGAGHGNNTGTKRFHSAAHAESRVK